MGQLTGIEVRHAKACATRNGGKCNCRPTYQANVWSARDEKRLRKTFRTLATARAWRAEAQTAIRRGTMRAPAATTVRETAEDLVEGMRSGRVRTRSGDIYKPSAIRSYEGALRDRILPILGGKKLADVQRRDVQRLADELLGAGLDPSTVRNALMPLRVIFRRAIEDGDLALNPTSHLRLPAVRGRRERIASPEEAQRLLAALPDRDRAVWATALYAGLRRGELMALRWENVDLAKGVIRVELAYDEKSRVEVEPKSHAGRRTVPIVGALRDELVAHRARQNREAGLAFGATAETPFVAHGARLDPDDVRPLRKAHARLGGRGSLARRCASRSSGHVEQARPARLVGELTAATRRAPGWVSFSGSSRAPVQPITHVVS